MKKATRIIAILAALTILGGCGQTAPAAPAAAPSTGSQEAQVPAEEGTEGAKQFEGTTIYMIAEQSTPTEAMENQLDAFYELTGITVDLEKAPYEDVVQKEVLAFEGKTGAYDIIAAPCEHLGKLVENGYVQTIDGFLEDESLAVIDGFDKDDLVKNLWDASSNWKDSYYGVPANSCSMFMAYRKDLFENPDEQAAFKEKYGYDLAPATEWDKYRDIAEFFTRKAGDTLAGEVLENDFYGVSMSGKKHPATTCEFLNYLWSFGGDIFDENGEVAINSDAAVEALEYYVDLTQFAPPGVTSKTWDEQVTEMQQGIAAMAIMFNDGMPSLEDPSASAVIGKMGYAPVPVKARPASFYGGWGYYIPADSSKAEAAWLFIEWFCTPEVQRGIMDMSCLPNISSLYQDEEVKASIPFMEESLNSFEICVAKPRIPEWGNIDSSMQLQLSNAIAKEKSPKEAMDAIAADLTDNILKDSLPLTYK